MIKRMTIMLSGVAILFGGLYGFHLDGFSRELMNMPARLVIPVPAGIALRTRGMLAGSGDPIPRAVEPDRAGVVPRTPDKPGE